MTIKSTPKEYEPDSSRSARIRDEPAARRAYAGAVGALLVALLYITVIGMLYLLHGQSEMEEKGLSFWSVVMAFGIGALIGGPIAGLLSPLSRWSLGAAFVGLAGLLPFHFTLVWLIHGRTTGDYVGVVVISCGVSLLLGAPLGIFAARDLKKNPLPDYEAEE